MKRQRSSKVRVTTITESFSVDLMTPDQTAIREQLRAIAEQVASAGGTMSYSVRFPDKSEEWL